MKKTAQVELKSGRGQPLSGGIGALDPATAALVKGFQAGAVEERALKDAVFSFLVITDEAAGRAAAHAGVDLAALNITNATLAEAGHGG